MKLQVRLLHRTEGALLVNSPQLTGEAVWIPRSVVKTMLKLEVGPHSYPLYELDVDDWFIQKTPKLENYEI